MRNQQLIMMSLVGYFVLCAGCAQNPYGTAYTSADARQVQSVQTGTIVKLNPVTIDGAGNAVGTIAGAAVGGILGSDVGEGKGSDLAAIAGGVLGGMLGNKAGEAVSRKQGVNITIKLDNGRTIAIVQQVDPNAVFQVGNRVNIYGQGTTARVVRA